MTVNTRAQALAAARALADDLGRFDVGMCLREIRQLYDIPAHDFTPGDGKSPDAAQAWRYARRKHPLTSPEQLVDVPAGVPVFWLGGSAGHGHIAMKAGHKPGTRTPDVWSTDFLAAGRLDRVDGRKIGPKWDMRLVGWTEDLNAVRVYTPPARPKSPVTTGNELVDQALEQYATAAAGRVSVHHLATQIAAARQRMPTR